LSYCAGCTACLVLGLDEIIGNFEVGKEFDALLVEPRVNRSKFVVVSNFDTVQVGLLTDRTGTK